MVPRHTDKFWLVPWMFSDKAGWENMTTVMANSGLLLNGLTANDYLAKHHVRLDNSNEETEDTTGDEYDIDAENAVDNQKLGRLVRGELTYVFAKR